MHMDIDTAAKPAATSLLLDHTRKTLLPSLVSGGGGALAIWLLATLTERLEQALLIAPFGASCVLLMALPQSPLARPRNVVGGHFLSALMGLIVLNLIGGGILACGLGVGLAIAVMQFTGTLHPPAGGNPLIVILTGASWSFLGAPILAGTLILLVVAFVYHRFATKRPWPAP